MQKTTQINGLKINYQVTGSGHELILLHGWGADLSVFSQTQNFLSQYFTVYNLDLPGFGNSEEPTEIWGIEKYTQFLEDFCESEKIKNPILIGHSFGGRISILFSSRNKVKKIILVDSAGVKPKRKLNYYIKVYSYKTIKNILKLPVLRNFSEQILEKYRGKTGSKDYQRASGVMRKILVKVVNEDLQNVMPEIKAPTLLIWGENDTATPVSDGKIMEKLIPDAGIAILKNAGHYSFLEKQDEFLIIINNFLSADIKQ